MRYLRKFKNVFAPVLFLLISDLSVAVEQEHILFKSITTDDGLSSSNILSILQDDNGFIWIATYDGLNRYDSKNFKIYRHEINDPGSLPDNLIRSLFLDSENNLYVGTNSGISRYDKSADEFINYTRDSSSCLFNMNFQARKITIDKQGLLWIATNLGLLKFDIKNNVYTFFTHNQNEPGSLSNSFCNDVFIDSKNRIWISTQKGLNIFEPAENNFRQISRGTNGEDFSGFLFTKATEDKDGTIWINSENGLFKVDEKENKSEYLIHFKAIPGDPNSISSNLLSEIFVDDKNTIWIGAENNGMFQHNRTEQNFSRIISGGSNITDLTKISINAIFEDNAGNMWFGTYGHGILMASKNGYAISLFEEFIAGENSFSGLLVNCFLEDKQGRIWIGTDGNGIFQFDKITRQFIHFNTKNSGLTNNYILSMAEDEDGMIWMATWDGGLIGFNPDRKTFTSFNTKNSSIPDNKIYTITIGNNKEFWLGSHYAGLIKFNVHTNTFTTINQLNNNLGENTINVITPGRNRNLYIGTTNGLTVYDPETNEVNKITETTETLKNIRNVEVNDIVIENDTSLWIATLLGLYHLNTDKEILTTFSTEDGLPGNVITGLLSDGRGHLWISTTSGICRLNRNNSKFTCFTREDGLQSNEFRPRSLKADSDGNLYFGGVNGFNIINPDKVQKNNSVPPVQFTGLDIFHQPVHPGTPGSPLKQVISETSEIKLNYKQTSLTFYFAVLDYTSPDKNSYAYKLENFDEDWTFPESYGEANYTNLDPGKYTLRIKGANNHGVWNETGTILRITITPPWWQTWWFRILASMFLVLLIFTILYVRFSSLRKQKIMLEAKVQQRTKELAEINATKDKLFSIIAHDLISPFNVLMGYTELLIQNYKTFSDKELLDILSGLSQTTENTYLLLKNLLDWSRSQRGAIKFKPVEINTSELVLKTLDGIHSLAAKKQISIINHITTEQKNVFADVNMITLVLRNLLMNAIKFSNPEGKIFVDTENRIPGFVTFKISDEGVGIEQDKLKNLFILGESTSTKGTDGEKGTGLGLILSNEFVTKHNGEIWVESEPGKGSTFYFTVPEC